MALSSCDDGNDNATTTKAENSNVDTQLSFIPSLDFIKNIESDNFYEKDQREKKLLISNLILLRYIINADNEVVLECAGYSPENKVFNDFCFMCNRGGQHGYKIGDELFKYDGNSRHYIFSIKLKNPKDVKMVSLYDGTKKENELTRCSSDYFFVQNTMSISGVFKGLSAILYYELSFDDCNITIEQSFSENEKTSECTDDKKHPIEDSAKSDVDDSIHVDSSIH
jgi:hypothetical protein